MFIAIAQLAVELPIAQEVVIERDNQYIEQVIFIHFK